MADGFGMTWRWIINCAISVLCVNRSFKSTRDWPFYGSMQILMIRISQGEAKNMEVCISLLILMHEWAVWPFTPTCTLCCPESQWDLAPFTFAVIQGCWHHPPSEWTACVLFTRLHVVVIPRWRRAHNGHSQFHISSWPVSSSS